MKFMIYKLALMSLVMASAVMSKAANAQAKVIVPFAFNMGGVAYPAGTYFIERVPLSRFVSLENKDGWDIQSWVLGSGDPKPADTRVGLVFDVDTSRHLLRAIRYGALITSRLDGYTRSNRQVALRHHEGD